MTYNYNLKMLGYITQQEIAGAIPAFWPKRSHHPGEMLAMEDADAY
jgi:hypothetical protein